MDPNLIKIIRANISNINHGDFISAIDHATHYLHYILGHKRRQIDTELDQFVACISGIHQRSSIDP